MKTGRITSQWPYSLTTQTRAPEPLGGVEHRERRRRRAPDKTGHVAARGPEALGVVVEVRQIDQRQVGPFAREPRQRTGDPARARESGVWPPEGEERELAELGFEAFGEASGGPVMPKTLLPSAP